MTGILGPAFRLGLVAVCTVWIFLLVLLADWKGWPRALIVGVGGLMAAVGAYELRDRPAGEEGRERRERPRRPVGARRVDGE